MEALNNNSMQLITSMIEHILKWARDAQGHGICLGMRDERGKGHRLQQRNAEYVHSNDLHPPISSDCSMVCFS